jgi:NAD(P)-dependent dehydrogenase (short-subunit alcohol dehydrogenase family)
MLLVDALAGKSIVVTGGGTGIGLAMATHFAELGATVHLWGRREGVLAEAVAGIGDAAHAQVVDVRDADAVDAAVDELWAAHGPLTGVLNNAGANFIAQTEQLSHRAFRALTSTIMDGSFHTTHAVGRRWIAEGLPGSVVSTLATWVWTGSAFVTPAAMAKAAVHSMTMSLAAEWARHNIRVNAVAPGPFPTDFAWSVLAPTGQAAVGATQADQIPAGRFGELAELGNLMAFLYADGCDYLTGATIPIDGGQMLAGPNTLADLARLSDEEWASATASAKAAAEQSKAGRAG